MAFNWVKKTGFVLAVTCLVFSVDVPAQETAPLTFLSGVPQSAFENPAVQNQTGKLVIGVPVLSGVYGQWNSSVPFNSLFQEGFSYNLHRFYDALDEQGNARASAGMTMFYANLERNGYTFSLSVSERAFSASVFDREIVRIIRDGIMDFYDSSEDLGNASFYLRHYREVAPGISKRVWKNLDVGIRPKILFGKFNIDATDLHISTEADQERNQLLVRPEGSLTLSGPLSQSRDSADQFSSVSAHVFPGDYFFQFRNLGVALDAGVVFRPDKFTELSVSLIDVGMIGYRHNTFDVDFTQAARFPKENAYQSYNPDSENDDYMEPREALIAFGDSISYLVDVDEAEERSFSALPFKLNLKGKYRFSEKITAGLSNQFRYFRRFPQNMFSAFVETSLHPKFNMYGSFTLLNSESLLPGFGASYTAEWIQLFFASNNISGIIQPASSKDLNLCFGINFLFETH